MRLLRRAHRVREAVVTEYEDRGLVPPAMASSRLRGEEHQRMVSIKSWAADYKARGFALARIKPGQKRPTDRGWTVRSCEPDEFRRGDSIGLQGGRLSGD